jgi:hypothetical protein
LFITAQENGNLEKGDCLTEVTAWAGLNIHLHHQGRVKCQTLVSGIIQGQNNKS